MGEKEKGLSAAVTVSVTNSRRAHTRTQTPTCVCVYVSVFVVVCRATLMGSPYNRRDSMAASVFFDKRKKNQINKRGSIFISDSPIRISH